MLQLLLDFLLNVHVFYEASTNVQRQIIIATLAERLQITLIELGILEGEDAQV